MCTASWLIGPNGFELFFNRDELRTRGEASPPREFRCDGVLAIAPVDADAGGTWIGVNEFGLALGLLNAWNYADRPGAEYRSRGLLVRELLALSTPDAVRARVESLDLALYRGFSLAVFAPDAPPALLKWDGREFALGELGPLLSSSSLDATGAESARVCALAEARADRAVDALLLESFHKSHAPERGALSPCMHRVDAATVSSSHIRVEGDRIAFRYAPGPPCRTPYARALEFRRRAINRGAVGR